MSASIISGKVISAAVLKEISSEVSSIKQTHNVTPGLLTLLVGDNPASLSYVSLKVKTAKDLGFNEVQITLPGQTSQAELIQLIKKYNSDPAIHGILVQLPLPPQINANKVVNEITPEKDVDGLHSQNLGTIAFPEGSRGFVPCTALGVRELLTRSNIPIPGADVVILGRSSLVGRPLSILLSAKGEYADATVTVVHSGSKEIQTHCRRADILIPAIGSPGFVRGDWIKPGAVVIDVGVTRIGEKVDSNGKKRAVLSGDVAFEEARQVATAITPVPGGVGPMTIAMLMQNTLLSCKRSLGIV